jgi:hypothetical protein
LNTLTDSFDWMLVDGTLWARCCPNVTRQFPEG